MADPQEVDVRKHGRNTRNHVVNGARHRDEMPGRPVLTKQDAMRAVGPVVYAVRVRDLIKIGHTTDLAARTNALQASEVLALIPGTYEDEQQLHRRLAEHVHHGREWYYPTPGVLAVVNEMREQLGQDPLAA
jgi:hypothetical protein